MLVQIQVLRDGKVLEDYTAPDGSWIQCDTVGAQHLPAITKASEYTRLLQGTEYTIRFTPINAPSIPEKLAKLINGFDKKWGRNGHEWMGSHREHSGGTTLDRARELHGKWGWIKKDNDFPLKNDAETTAFLDQNYVKVWKDRI